MRIRQMRAGDIDAVAAIEAGFSSPWSRAQVAAECARQTGIALVALSPSGELQGWCCALLVGPDAELLKIGIAPSWRRQGIARALLRKLCQRCGELGAEEIFLEVRSQNSAARQLYRKLGWQETGRRPGYYRKPVDEAIIYRRILQREQGAGKD